MKVGRRDFLRISALTGGGIVVNIMLPFAAKSTDVKANTFEPNLFVKIASDNTVTFTLTKQEMGQGVSTGMPMIFADEMGADLHAMKIIHSDYNPRVEFNLQGITGGSSSIQKSWIPLRQSAAMAREILIQAAAEIWGVNKHDCYTKKSKVVHRPTGKELTFGSLVEKAVSVPTPRHVKLKDPRDFDYIGKPVQNLHSKDIVIGKFNYGLDVSIPKMLYATIERSPVHLGKVKSFDDGEARKVEGVIRVVKIDQMVRPVPMGVPGRNIVYDYTIEEGLAVVATSSWAAIQGRKALKISWDEGVNSSVGTNSFRERVVNVKESDLHINVHKGDFPTTFANAKKKVEGTYEIPYLAHCLMEPLNTTASVKGNFCEIWSGHQFAQRVIDEVSSVLNIPADSVVCHILPSGCGFGRRWEADFVVEAALISNVVQQPVKTFWTREDEIRYDFFHAPQHDTHRVGLNENNMIVAWNTDQYCSFKLPKGAPWNPYIYSVKNYKARKIDLPSPLETGPWRSVNEHKDALTIESFIDEVAHSVKVDPLQYRLDLLSMPLCIDENMGNAETESMKLENDRRLTKQVLELAAEKAGWGNKTNLGIAVARFGSHCAQVAEVEVEKGKLIVKKITVAIHCGTVINPLLVETQVQGAVIYALQALHYGGITIENGRVQQSNFHNYKMMRIHEIPEISVHIVPSTDAPKSIGEPGVPPLAPAVLNSLFALSGKRIRKIPVLNADIIGL